MRDYITTFSGIHFTPLSPRMEDIRIEDIAHALSLMTRANGHFREFYSVAQHSLDCTHLAAHEGRGVREQLACLLHDASEAYLSDVTRPVKAHLTEYREIERRLQGAIYEKYLLGELTEGEAGMVKRIDDICLYYEFEHFMGERLFDVPPETVWVPKYRTQTFAEAEREFLDTFSKLMR